MRACGSSSIRSSSFGIDLLRRGGPGSEDAPGRDGEGVTPVQTTLPGSLALKRAFKWIDSLR